MWWQGHSMEIAAGQTDGGESVYILSLTWLETVRLLILNTWYTYRIKQWDIWLAPGGLNLFWCITLSTWLNAMTDPNCIFPNHFTFTDQQSPTLSHLAPSLNPSNYAAGLPPSQPIFSSKKYPHYRPMWPRGAQEVKAPRFLDTRHMKAVRSSPLRAGRLYPQEYPGTHF